MNMKTCNVLIFNHTQSDSLKQPQFRSFHQRFCNDHRTRPTPFDHANIADCKFVETAEAFNPGCVKENAEIESGRRGRRDRTLSASWRRQGRVAIPISHQVRPPSRLTVSLPSQRGWWWLRIIHGRRTPTIRRKFQRNARSPVDFRGEYRCLCLRSACQSFPLLLTSSPSSNDGRTVESSFNSTRTLFWTRYWLAKMVTRGTSKGWFIVLRLSNDCSIWQRAEFGEWNQQMVYSV